MAARLHLFAEGTTELVFTREVLIPHLASLGVYLYNPVRVAEAYLFTDLARLSEFFDNSSRGIRELQHDADGERLFARAEAFSGKDVEQPHLGDQRVLFRLEILDEDPDLHDVRRRRARLLQAPHHPCERRFDVLAQRGALSHLSGDEDRLHPGIGRGHDLREAAGGIDVFDLRRGCERHRARDEADENGMPKSARHGRSSTGREGALFAPGLAG